MTNQLGGKDRSTETAPIVVIGGGLGGLCSAAYLARAGLPVTLIESQAKVGGYATSFKRGRFTFEVSLHGSTLRGEAPQDILADLGIRERLQLTPLPECYRLMGGAVDIVIPQCDPEAYISLLCRHFPHEASGIRSFVCTMIAVIEENNHLHRSGGRIVRPLFPLRYPKMWRWRRATLAKMIASHVADHRLTNLLGGLWSYFGLPPTQLSAFYYAVAVGEFLKYGSVYIRPRSQQLSHLLQEAVIEAGGEVLTRVSATGIHLESDCVAAVSVSDGRRFDTQTVISNISPQVMMARLLPHRLKHHRRLARYSRHRPSLSAFIVWLGLNTNLPPNLEGAEYHINLPEGPEAEYRAALAGDVQQGAFIVTLYDNILPDYSAPDAATVSILFLCAYTPWQRFADDYTQGHKQAYKEEKARWADILIHRAEQRLFPNLSAGIEEIATATPLTCERYTGHPEGAIYGYEQCVDNAFITRLPNRSPIKGLYLAGAWSFPGGGFGPVLRSGLAAYQAVMADLGLDSLNR
jgi:prolycopene isomerase